MSGDTEKWTKTETRTVIKYLVQKKMKPTEIHEDLVNTLGECAPSYSTTKKWAAEFKRGRLSIEDDPRSGRPQSAVTEENIKKVHKKVLENRRLKVSDVAEDLDISVGSIYEILTTHLHMKKLSARWVPRLLSDEQKRDRAKVCRSNLAILRRNRKNFLRCLVTGDETWVHYVTPETKKQSNNGNTMAHHVLRKRRWKNQLERSWHQFSRIKRVF